LGHKQNIVKIQQFKSTFDEETPSFISMPSSGVWQNPTFPRGADKRKYATLQGNTEIFDSVLQALSFRSNGPLIWNPEARIC
jgi:hypothetical protein